jgi:serine/threonine protein kinase
VSDPTTKSTPHNSGASSNPEATLDSAAAPLGVPAPDLGSIGPYQLIRKLGEGEMGQVWLAEQSAPVKRQVVLKIIKAGRYDESALLRYDVERQALAIMNHPAIAKVFDAGSTPRYIDKRIVAAAVGANGSASFAEDWMSGYSSERRSSFH